MDALATLSNPIPQALIMSPKPCVSLQGVSLDIAALAALLDRLPLHTLLDIDPRYLAECEAARAPPTAQPPVRDAGGAHALHAEPAEAPAADARREDALHAQAAPPPVAGDSRADALRAEGGAAMAGAPGLAGATGVAHGAALSAAPSAVQPSPQDSQDSQQDPQQNSSQEFMQDIPSTQVTAPTSAAPQPRQPSSALSTSSAQETGLVAGRAAAEPPGALGIPDALGALAVDEDADIDELLGMSAAPQRPGIRPGFSTAGGGSTSVVGGGGAQAQPSLEDWLDDL